MKHVDMRKLPAAAQEERRRQVIGLRQAGMTYDAIAVRMMSFVKPCDPSSTLDVRGTLASGQALGAIDSYPVGRADPGALCTASKR